LKELKITLGGKWNKKDEEKSLKTINFLFCETNLDYHLDELSPAQILLSDVVHEVNRNVVLRKRVSIYKSHHLSLPSPYFIINISEKYPCK
jgi:hypothetical protein